MMDSRDRDYSSKWFCEGFSHVQEVGGYWAHFKFGGMASLWLMFAFWMAIIHILIPHLFPSVADNTVVWLGGRSMKPRGWKVVVEKRSAEVPEWMKSYVGS